MRTPTPVKPAVRAADSRSSTGERRWAIPEPGGRGDVLLVEDNVLNQMVAVGILSRLGYHAEVVDNGREAVEAVGRGHYGAVLMDCQLPGLDGYQATAEIRRREGAARHTPIIAMTAAASQEDRQRCLAAGMDGFVVKPVLVADVAAALSRWLDGGTAAPVGTDAAVSEPELVKVYLAVAPADLASLRAAVEAGDATAVDRAAHHLKGAAATLGLATLVDLCGELELLGGAGALQPAREVLARLAEEFERTLAVLPRPEVTR
jgi:CheY-like chemotaxis protein/HPt (histidine-containing phosphotransfer) domain-containing protein